MQANNLGRIVTAEWIRSADIRAEIELGEFVVMPNHFHGIAHIVDGCKGDQPVAPCMGLSLQNEVDAATFLCLFVHPWGKSHARYLISASVAVYAQSLDPCR